MKPKLKQIVTVLMTLVIILTSTISAAHAASSYYPACSQNHTSISDALISIGENGSYSNRATIATANNVESYRGTANQNLQLLSLLKAGKLRRPNSNLSTTPSSTTISNTLPSVSNYYPTLSPAHTFFDGIEIYGHRGEISVCKKEGAPIRSRPYKDGDVLYELEKGEPIQAISLIRNKVGNYWIQLFVPGGGGRIGYVYGGNVEQHHHSFINLASFGYEGFKVCTGCATVVKTEPAEITTDDIHLLLSVVSLEQTVGNAFDIVDGLVYLTEGEIGSAGLSLAAAVPWVSGKLDALQLGKNAAQTIRMTTRRIDVVAAITRVNENVLKIASKADSKVLARNMETAFFETGDFRFFNWSDSINMVKKSFAAHHIVPGGAKDAEAARKILEQVGIDINAAENGVWLCMKSGVCNGTIHAGGHSKAYYDAVNDALTTAYESRYSMKEKKEAVVAALNDIATRLRTGDLSL